MNNNKHKATVILIVFSFGFLASYPFSRDNFWIGLFSSICAASMIGGLADWFAVTAIFRKPLGIYWPRKVFRTEIIPRNREGIIKALVEIVENDLLSKESIKRKIMNIKLYELFTDYMKEKTNSGKQYEMIEKALEQIYQSLKPEDVESIIIGAADHFKRKIDMIEIIKNTLNLAMQKGYDEYVLDEVVDLSTGFIKSGKAHEFFTKFVEDVIKEYESDSSSRAMTIKMIMNYVLKMTPSDIAKLVENELVNAIVEVKDNNSENRAKVRKRVQQFIDSLDASSVVGVSILGWFEKNQEMIGSMVNKVSSRFAEFKNENQLLTASQIGNKISNNFGGQLEDLLKSTEDSDAGEKIDAYIKELLINFINKKHSTIGHIVRDRIDQFSTEELVNLIEDTAGNDLQMIRINGSVVGGIVGMLTYLLTFSIR